MTEPASQQLQTLLEAPQLAQALQLITFLVEALPPLQLPHSPLHRSPSSPLEVPAKLKPVALPSLLPYQPIQSLIKTSLWVGTSYEQFVFILYINTFTLYYVRLPYPQTLLNTSTLCIRLPNF